METLSMDSPHKGAVMWSFNVFFVVWMNILLNIELSCQWFEMPWHSCDIFALTGCFFHRFSDAVWIIGPQIFPDSKVHGANMGTHLGPVGPRWAPWTLLSGLFLWHQSHNRVWWLLMAWHPYGTKAPGSYLIQYQPRAMLPDGITWPQCVHVQNL